MPGVLVTGTDTGVGKTVLAAAIVAALVARGLHVVAHKPVLTGIDALDVGELGDHDLLGLCAGMPSNAVAPLRFGPAVSPHLAAQLAGQTIDIAALLARIRAIRADALIVEGVGGLLVPISPGWDLRRLTAEIALPVVIAARPGLGTINHTLLTVEAARGHGLDVRAVVITPWPERPSPVEQSNLRTIADIAAVTVVTLGRVDPLTPDVLARAGALLPLDAWISRESAVDSDRLAP